MQLVKELHTCYVKHSEQKIAYNLARENAWRDWCAWGNWEWTCDDLARVINYLLAEIKTGKRNLGALKFSNLVGRPDNFEEDLQLSTNTHAKRTSATGRSDSANSAGRYR